MPTMERRAPIGSSLASSGSRDFGMTNFPAISATTMMGTFTRNTEPYQKWPRSKPLATGPKAPAAPVMLAQIAIAFGRSWGGKMLMMIDKVDGMMSAAAAPITARLAMSSAIDVDAVARSAPTRKRT